MMVPAWLRHLRTDRRGLPVPWVNLWGPEETSRLEIRYDRYAGRPGVFIDDTRQPIPDFTRQHMGRQREAMAGGRCQVCGRLLHRWPRYLVISDMSVQMVEVPGRGQVPLVTEPWLCRRCADFAVETCPALIRRSRTEQLRVLTVPAPTSVRMVVTTGWIDGPLEAESCRVQPALWVKALVDGLVCQLAQPGDGHVA
jgi:hypothetical protein